MASKNGTVKGQEVSGGISVAFEGDEVVIRAKANGAAVSTSGKSKLLVNSHGFQSLGDGRAINLTITESLRR